MKDKMHKWERDGFGKAPFKCVGVAEMPSPSLAEHNPTAYNNAMAMLPKGYGCGTCNVCGMGIKYNYLIKSADGKTFSVGCECVLKRGPSDKMLVDAVKAERNKLDREKRAEKRRLEWEARKAKADAEREAKLEEERKRNDGLTDAEVEQHKAMDRAKVMAPIVDSLKDGRGGFRDSMAYDMSQGRIPRNRALDIVCDIMAKMAGRRNSKAYEKEYDRVAELIEIADQ